MSAYLTPNTRTHIHTHTSQNNTFHCKINIHSSRSTHNLKYFIWLNLNKYTNINDSHKIFRCIEFFKKNFNLLIIIKSKSKLQKCFVL